MAFSEEMNQLGMMLLTSHIVKTFKEMAEDIEKQTPEIQAFFKTYEDKIIEHALALERVFGKSFFDK